METRTQWETPLPLHRDNSGLINFPINAMPLILREMAKAISDATLTDVGMACTAMLPAFSYCLSGMYRMVGKKSHTEPLVIDSLTVAESSSKKSPVINFVKKPFEDFGRDYNEKHKLEIFEAQQLKKKLQAKLSAMEKNEDPDPREMAQLRMEISSIRNDVFRRVVVEDITPEALMQKLSENGTLLMMSDEAGLLGNFNGRYSGNGPNLDLLLKSWNGETYIYDRATKDSISLEKPYLSISLATQPYNWLEMISNTAFHGSGLVARFLYCFPKSNIGQRRYDTQPIPESVIEGYKKLIYKLLHDKFIFHDEKEIFLRFDSKAFSEFVDFYNGHIEKQLVTDMAFCRDWGGKYHGEILRLCGIIHCVKCALDGKNPAEVNVNIGTLCNSIDIADYYREQAIYAYSIGDTDMATVKAEKVLAKIKSKFIQNIRQNDLYKMCRCTLFKNTGDFNETMSMLEEYGYIRRETVQGANGNNKNGLMIHVNPLIYNS